jgi:hypothetical protein
VSQVRDTYEPLVLWKNAVQHLYELERSLLWNIHRDSTISGGSDPGRAMSLADISESMMSVEAIA